MTASPLPAAGAAERAPPFIVTHYAARDHVLIEGETESFVLMKHEAWAALQTKAFAERNHEAMRAVRGIDVVYLDNLPPMQRAALQARIERATMEAAARKRAEAVT